jgi:hypothetical protein
MRLNADTPGAEFEQGRRVHVQFCVAIYDTGLSMLKSDGPAPINQKPCDSHILGHLNKVLKGCGFRSDKNVKVAQ